MNDVIKTMYNQHIEEMSSYDDKVSSYNDEYEELVGENIGLTLKIAELENKLEEIRVEMIWCDDDDSWKCMFEASGYFESVDCQIEGLGRIDAVTDLYIAHTKAAIDSIQ